MAVAEEKSKKRWSSKENRVKKKFRRDRLNRSIIGQLIGKYIFNSDFKSFDIFSL